MIYLIGGPPRVGKSTLAQMLTSKNQVPFVSTDPLYHMLFEVAPQLEVHDKNGFEDKALRMYPYLRQFILQTHWTLPDYCMEGDSFQPAQVNDLLNDPEFKDEEVQIKCCFLGLSETNLETILSKSGHNEWLTEQTKEKQEQIVKWIIERSEWTKKECEKYNFKYFDLAENYPDQLQQAYQYLAG